MIGFVMAGGRGSRMDSDIEKLLLVYKKPVILHVIDALVQSECFTDIIAITSPHAPNTQKLLEDSDTTTLHTAGAGYSQDLGDALDTIHDDVFVASGDMPLLDARLIRALVSQYNPRHTWTSFVADANHTKEQGEFFVDIQGKKCLYTGVSLVNARNLMPGKMTKEHYIIINDKRLSFNLNTKSQYDSLNLV